MLCHKFCKTLCVYQDHALSQMAHIRLGGKSRCRDENALCGTEPYKAPYEALPLGCLSLGGSLRARLRRRSSREVSP
jgi:hypothetical protein